MAAKTQEGRTSSQPWLHQHGKEIQTFGSVRQFPLAFLTRLASIPASG